MMITDDQALEALRRANPAPDWQGVPEQTWTASVLLDDTARRMAMQTNDTKPTKLDPRQPRRPRSWLIAVAASAIAVVGISALVLANTDDPGSAATTTPAPPATVAAATTAAPTTSAAPTTTVPTLSEAEAQEIVNAAFAAFNSGDMDTWALWRESGAATWAMAEYDLAVGARLSVESCTYRGFQVWTSVDIVFWEGHGFDCSVTYTDDLLEAGGIEMESTYNWVIGADPETSLGGSNEDWDGVAAFLVEYRDWLAATYPEIAATIQYEPMEDPEDDEFPMPTPGSVPTALDYVDEFVAQSDVYPITEPIPEAFWYGGPLR